MHARFSLLLSLLAVPLLAAGARPMDAERLPIHDGVGGEFSAQSSLGREVSLSEFRGKVVLLFFGYTSCVDVCPATLAYLKSLVTQIGPAAEDVQILLITVDPENDTPERLREYLSQFDSRFVGIGGTREESDRIAKLFMASYDESHGVKVSTEYHRSKTHVEETYLYSHSQQIYLLDKAGQTRALFFLGSPVDEMQAAVLALLGEGVAEGDPCIADGREGVACPRSPTKVGQPEGNEKETQ
ncbi:MAG: SCO family protein [bacterium]|nr:SCO family protein [bacterium]MDP7073073.1 SCO family protein [Myxococcota bacterium]MDP7299217.1 SCO family protein [Myxococcota bacterium]HJO23783.1 SCO family protein [Myxococcota bacterium]